METKDKLMDTYSTISKVVCSSASQSRRPVAGRAEEHGVALVITLLTLALITVLSLGMVIAFSSQTLIGGYYRNYRGAFYAADSGLNVARQQMMSEIVASVPATFTMPITGPTATACGLISSVTVGTTYGTPTNLNTGTAANSWNESFKLTNAIPSTPLATPTGVNSYSCSMGYSITSVGTAQGTEQQTVTESGNIIFSVQGASAKNNVSFAYFGAFVDNYPPGIGPLVPGTMTGPMFTNQAWEFMANQPPWTSPYIFTDPIGQVMSSVDYWDTGWGQHWVAGPSYGSGANLIAPTFESGLFLNQPNVPLPSNAFNQLEAVVDGVGDGLVAPANLQSTMNQILKDINGNPYPASGTPSSGVYLPWYASGSTDILGSPASLLPASTTVTTTSGTTVVTNPYGTNPASGGGIVIEGNADVQLVPVGATEQDYIITQNGTTTTIKIDPALGTTVVIQGGTSKTFTGVPMNAVPATATPAAMIYVNGTMTFHGPGEGQGAIQDNAMITMTANGDAIATGDVLYKTEPVTVPADTLIPAVANMNQVLGIYTANGNFITADTQADQNIEVDGTIATISSLESSSCNGQGGQLSYGHINTFNNVGGMAQSCIYAADVNTENTWFDRRYTARPNFAPPWFPSTTITTGGALPSTPGTPNAQRVQWLSTSSQ
jgi:Tfp pilus assembly protein PilX